MLSKIWIKNFALIQELHFDFLDGYTVITGETGSGKSILLGALNLILGERADFSLIGPDSDKTFVEAEFNLTGLDFESWFLNNDIDFEVFCLVRREINKQGRSRAFVNDTPVSLLQLKQLTEHLVQIHSQHHTLALKNKDFHLELLDILAGIDQEVYQFGVEFHQVSAEKKFFKAEEKRISQAEADRDYLTFQLEEMEVLLLEKTDYKSLEEELLLEENIDDIISALDSISNSLIHETGTIPVLKALKIKLERGKTYNSKLEELASRLNSAVLELEDIASESSRYLDHLEKNPERILELTSKLDAYNRVAQKHKCATQLELLALKNSWQMQLTVSSEGKTLLEKLKKSITLRNEKLEKWAVLLHEKRSNSCLSIEKSIVELLADLKMPETNLNFKLNTSFESTSKGKTEISILFSTNKGIPAQPIEKIASGGELSRLMLAIQCLISEKKKLPSIIFDEIDTGVSGEVAQKIGNLLQRMGKNLQLIAISHLPQVAAKSTSHLKVEKFEKEGRVLSSLRQLTELEKVEEIARLMSGAAINDAALVNARSLMDEL